MEIGRRNQVSPRDPLQWRKSLHELLPIGAHELAALFFRPVRFWEKLRHSENPSSVRPSISRRCFIILRATSRSISSNSGGDTATTSYNVPPSHEINGSRLGTCKCNSSAPS